MGIKLDSHEWVRKQIAKDWFDLEGQIPDLYDKTLNYMIDYIANRKRRQPSSGNLELNIKNFSKLEAGAGVGKVSFGIGHIPSLTKYSPWWYVLAYGKKVTGERFLPGGGQYKPVGFGFSNMKPASNLKGTGKGTQIATSFGKGSVNSFINPINYIESTIHQFGQWIEKILPKSGRSY